MALKKPYQLFFAIPFDAATKEMYARIGKQIHEKFEIETFMGTMKVPPSPDYADIDAFKAQNTDMISEMRQRIERADIIVADMTNNNPNVHFELGIALYLNKNILRVTGRSLDELGFDVRGLEVNLYRTEPKLLEKIERYIEMFQNIKDLPLSPDSGNLYRRCDYDKPIEAKGAILYSKKIPGFRMRDGAVRAVIEPMHFQEDMDWFGVFLRFEETPPIGGYLAYVRENGSVEIMRFPEQLLLKKEMLIPRLGKENKTFEVELEENRIRVSIDRKTLECDELRIQNSGDVAIAAFHSKVNFKTIEMVCRDTLNPSS